MSPEVTVGLFVLIGTVLAAFLPYLGGLLKSRSEHRAVAVTEAQAMQSAIAERWDDASELAKYIREQIEIEVERQVAPIRDELARVKSESHEMHDAVRARETQLWLWDQKGRPGDLPMLPAPILARLGLGYLITHEPSRKD
jgi:hypothetical protein